LKVFHLAFELFFDAFDHGLRPRHIVKRQIAVERGAVDAGRPKIAEALGLDATYLTRGVFAWARNANAVAPSRSGRLRRPQVRALKLSARRRSEPSFAAM